MKIPEYPSLIQNETVILDEQSHPILKFDVLPGKQSDPQKLTFSWQFVNFTATELLIQLDFDEKYYVSTHSQDPDRIRLTIYGFQLFADTFGNLMSPPTVLKVKILPQLADLSEVVAAQKMTNSARKVIQTTILTNTVISILISGPL